MYPAFVQVSTLLASHSCTFIHDAAKENVFNCWKYYFKTKGERQFHLHKRPL